MKIILIVLIICILVVLKERYNPKLDLSRGEYGWRLYLWYDTKENKRAYKVLYPFYFKKE